MDFHKNEQTKRLLINEESLSLKIKENQSPLSSTDAFESMSILVIRMYFVQ